MLSLCNIDPGVCSQRHARQIAVRRWQSECFRSEGVSMSSGAALSILSQVSQAGLLCRHCLSCFDSALGVHRTGGGQAGDFILGATFRSYALRSKLLLGSHPFLGLISVFRLHALARPFLRAAVGNLETVRFTGVHHSLTVGRPSRFSACLVVHKSPVAALAQSGSRRQPVLALVASCGPARRRR